MKLTNKCKIDFEKWFYHKSNLPQLYDCFNHEGYQFTQLEYFLNEISESMQYGVYVDFFSQVKYEGKSLFLILFESFYMDKTDDIPFQLIIEHTIDACNSNYNTIMAEIINKTK